MARILVVGGSLGGLMAANLLLRAGHDVTVLERSPCSLQGRGAGIVTHEGLRQALRAAGAVVDDTLGIPVAGRVVLGADGQTLCDWHHPQILTSWGRLYALLSDALPAAHHRLGAAVQAATAFDGHVSVQLAGGEVLQADLLIAADGIRSTVRSGLLPDVKPSYAGYVAWRGVCDEAVLSRHTRDTLFPHFGFGLPAGEQMLGYPVAGDSHAGGSQTGSHSGSHTGSHTGTDVGRRRWNFVWYRPAAAGAALDTLLSDADGQHYPDGIPPHRVSWRHMAAMRQAAREKLAPQFAEIVEKTAQPFLQPIYDLVSPQLAHGRIALMGDAAFVARPHVGMGVAKAGDDAVALAACIAAHGATPEALRRYDAERRPAGVAVVQRARELGAPLALPPGTARPYRDPRGPMQQTAIDPALFKTYPPEALAA